MKYAQKIRLEYRGSVEGGKQIVYEGVVLRETNESLIMDVQRTYLDGELHVVHACINLQQIGSGRIVKIRYVNEGVEGESTCIPKESQD